jgi:thioredoxin-related protein
MKKAIFLVAFFANFIFAADYFTDYKEGLALAQKENKVLAITVVSTNCPWCHKFIRETMKNPKISQVMKQNFVHIVLNKDTQEIPTQFAAKYVPATFFINNKGEKIATTAIGFLNSEDFYEFMEDAVKKSRK